MVWLEGAGALEVLEGLMGADVEEY